MQRSWKGLIAEIVDQLPPQFELRDITKYEAQLERFYPNNKHIGAKIRQTLQVLRDQGAIEFVGTGKYQKLTPATHFSPLLDFAVAADFSSRAQIARLALETWAELNLFCLNCESDSLVRLAANTPVADFECANCRARYQLKGKDGRFGSIIAGAAYGPLMEAIQSGICPDYVLVEYDTRFATVVFGTAIRGSAITPDRVVARKPLSPTAKRKGWIGCNVRIDGLPTVSVVEPHVVDAARARIAWDTLGDRAN
jgi:hypothetical protein